MTRNALNYSGSVGLNYRPLPGLEIGGQFARSHRNPTVEELYANGVHLGAGVYESGNPNLKDEVGHGGDLFVNWANDRISVELAGFINYFRNFIVFQPTGLVHEASGFSIFEYQGDEARLIGSEIQANFQLTDNFGLGAGLDYVIGHRISDITNGENLPFIPPFRFSTEFEYNIGNAWFGGQVRAVAKQDRVAPEEEITDGYLLLGFIAGYRLDFKGRHVLILRADNVLNASYRDHLSRMEDRNLLMPGRDLSLVYRWFF